VRVVGDVDVVVPVDEAVVDGGGEGRRDDERDQESGARRQA
jgi:hypothetical protein